MLLIRNMRLTCPRVSTLCMAVTMFWLICGNAAWAQWTDDVAVNTPVSTGLESYAAQLVHDGSGGYFCAFFVGDSAGTARVHVQRLDAEGNRLWGESGRALMDTEVVQDAVFEDWPVIVADGEGGAIICWWDTRGANGTGLYAQRIDGDGKTLWEENGVAVSFNGYGFIYPLNMVTDGAGGAILAWADYRDSEQDLIYAQRVSSAGELLWPTDSTGPDGMVVGEGSGVRLVEDGRNGAFFTWDNYRVGILAQRISGDGSPLWGDGGRVIHYRGLTLGPRIVADNAGGVIVSFISYIPEIGENRQQILAQRIGPDGTDLWTSGGVLLRTLPGHPRLTGMVSDGNNGALMLYNTSPDFTAGSLREYMGVQRVLGNGEPAWAASTEIYSTPAGINLDVSPKIVSDGENGAIISFIKRGPEWTNIDWKYDIQAQRVHETGSLMWGTDGIPVTIAEGSQYGHRLLAAGTGQAISTWEDPRTQPIGIFAQLVMGDENREPGPGAEPAPNLTANIKPDSKGRNQVKMRWKSTGKGIKWSAKYKILATNAGDAEAISFICAAYLSNDQAIDEGDILVKQVRVKKLAAGKGKSVSVKINGVLPAALLDSSLFLLFQVDSASDVAEHSETDNVCAIELFAPPWAWEEEH